MTNPTGRSPEGHQSTSEVSTDPQCGWYTDPAKEVRCTDPATLDDYCEGHAHTMAGLLDSLRHYRGR